MQRWDDHRMTLRHVRLIPGLCGSQLTSGQRPWTDDPSEIGGLLNYLRSFFRQSPMETPKRHLLTLARMLRILYESGRQSAAKSHAK